LAGVTLEFIGMAALLAASGFVSGSETALFSLNPNTQGFGRRPVDRLVRLLLQTEHRLLLTILILNNVINVLYFAAATVLASRLDPATPYPALMATGALLALILLGEVTPKVLATNMPLAFARVVAGPLLVVTRLMTPIHLLAERFLGGLVTDSGSTGAGPAISDAELKSVINASKERGVVSESVHDRLIEIVDLGNTLVQAVMQHRLEWPQVSQESDIEAVLAVLREQPAPYVLVNDEDDDCIGLLTPQDLLRGGTVNRRMRKPMVLPANATCAQALLRFQERNRSVALVVDEFGGTLGLLTLRDLTDELLDMSPPDGSLPAPERIADNKYILFGGQSLDGWDVLIDEADRLGCNTIGGFVTKQLGGLPQSNDRFLYNNLLFRVLDLSGRRIGRMEVSILDPYEARRLTGERIKRTTTKMVAR
jgi:CBS domain containing-hemolysin-like protein